MQSRLTALLLVLISSTTASPVRAQVAAELSNCGLEPGPETTVASVIDADSVRLADGKEVKLVGVLAPRAFDVGASPGTWLAEKEAQIALSTLVLGQTVALAFAGPRTDRHDRVLAHLILTRNRVQSWIQRELIRTGHARVHVAPGAGACLELLLTEEVAARARRAGLWSNAAYQVRPADRPSELERFRWTYQLVLGRIERLSGSRGMASADFESSESQPITGLVSRRPIFRVVWKRAGGTATAFASRKGAVDHGAMRLGIDVLVRGWIGGRAGPEIELLTPLQIDVQNGTAAREGLDKPVTRKERPSVGPPGAKRD